MIFAMPVALTVNLSEAVKILLDGDQSLVCMQSACNQFLWITTTPKTLYIHRKLNGSCYTIELEDISALNH